MMREDYAAGRPFCALLSSVLAVGCSGGAGGRADAGSSASSEGSESAGTDDGPPGLEPFEPTPAVLPRLTTKQYRNSVNDLLGSDLPLTPIEEDTNPYLFFSIGAATTALSELGVQQFEEAADAVTRVVFEDPARRIALVGCEPLAPGDACVSEFAARFGRRAFRRPLGAAELDRWVAVATDLAQPDAWEGVRLMTAGMLQSPHFLYRVELGEPDPDDPDRLRYTAWEMASRLSFLVWDTTPDETLLDAALAGDLDHTAGIAEQAERLLADPRARVALQAFFAQYLDLGRIDGLERDPANYPLFGQGMAGAMRTEAELLVDDVVFRQDGDVRSIFSTQTTFVNDQLAALYGVDAPNADSITFVPVELDPDGPRAGLLTLSAFLTMNAHETQTSPTARGKFVRERVLCQTVPPPPDDVDTDLEPPGDEPTTLREQLEQHRENPACAGCHAFIDPPGFLFEHFDSIGAYREDYNGLPLDASGELDGVPLADARELATLLEDEPQVGRCMVKQLFRHAQARLDTQGEQPVIEDLDERFAAADYRFRELVVELVTHEGFRTLAVPEEGP